MYHRGQRSCTQIRWSSILVLGYSFVVSTETLRKSIHPVSMNLNQMVIHSSSRLELLAELCGTYVRKPIHLEGEEITSEQIFEAPALPTSTTADTMRSSGGTALLLCRV